jgi:hydrogenase nickel incorporation protein HypB
MSTTIPLVRNILEANDRLADQLRRIYAENKLLALNLMSSPGAGKTSLLERTLTDLRDELCMAVIEGDLQTNNDAQRVAATGAQAVQINTEGGCHLDSSMILEALQQMDLSQLDVLFIENVGNLVCPAEFDLGEAAKVTVLSVTEGDDKPEKYPMMFAQSKALLLNKIDLLPYVDFDVNKAARFARALNPEIAVFHVSCRTGEGLEGWYDWLRETGR